MGSRRAGTCFRLGRMSSPNASGVFARARRRSASKWRWGTSNIPFHREGLGCPGPNTRTPLGRSTTYTGFVEQAHRTGALVAVAADLLRPDLVEAAGRFGADIALGSTQRLGVPLGYGGPHAPFLRPWMPTNARCRADRRPVKGPRASTGAAVGAPNREQHIRRERPRATSARRRPCWRNIASL